jgi:hypothetical protein
LSGDFAGKVGILAGFVPFWPPKWPEMPSFSEKSLALYFQRKATACYGKLETFADIFSVPA